MRYGSGWWAADMNEVSLTIDGIAVTVAQGATILEACRSVNNPQPTLCYLENLTPVNACRVCVVEVENNRLLVPLMLAARRRRHGCRHR